MTTPVGSPRIGSAQRTVKWSSKIPVEQIAEPLSCTAVVAALRRARQVIIRARVFGGVVFIGAHSQVKKKIIKKTIRKKKADEEWLENRAAI